MSMKYVMLLGATALALSVATAADAGGPGQKFSGGYYGGDYYGHYHGGHYGHHHGFGHFGHHGHGAGCYGVHAAFHGPIYAGAVVPALPPPPYNAGPPTPAVTYPYYTTRGPRDFLLDNPPPLGP
jgi:hypothetical protein